jgi:hypothetical protein
MLQDCKEQEQQPPVSDRPDKDLMVCIGLLPTCLLDPTLKMSL